MTKFVVTDSERVAMAFCQAVGLDPHYTSRVVVDLQKGSVGRVYFETFANDAVLDVILEGGGIQIVEREEEAAA